MSSPRRSVPFGWLWGLIPVLALAAWFVVVRRQAGESDDLIVDSPAIVIDPVPADVSADPVAAPAPATPEPVNASVLAASGSATVPPVSAAVETAPARPAEAVAVPPAPAAPDEPVLDAALYSEWTTFDDAVRLSRANDKPVLIAFHADWNEGSEALRRQVLDDVAAGLTVRATVIPVLLVDRTQEEGGNTAEWVRLAKRFGVGRLPALVVYSPGSGRMQRRQGWHGSAATLQWIGDAAAAVK